MGNASALAALLLCAAVARAEEGTVAKLLPAAADRPAPDWVRPGTRLTYYSSAASVPGDGEWFWREKDGGWVDAKGREYNRGDEQGQGGHGFTQVNVVSVRPERVVLDVRSYLLTDARTNGAPMLMGVTNVVDVAGAAGDFWVHPDALRAALKLEDEAVKVARVKLPLDGRTQAAIRIEYARKKARSVLVYDETTGALLQASTCSSSDDTVKEGVWVTGGRTQLTHSELRGIRDVEVPWRDGGRPAWLETARRLEFSGSVTVSVPGGFPQSLPYAMLADVAERGPDWTLFRQLSGPGDLATLDGPTGGAVNGVPTGPPTTFLRVTGPAQIGGFWLPAGIEGLEAGRVLDRDPITQVTATVVEAGARIVIAEANPLQRIDYAYDRASGCVVALRVEDRPLHMVTEVRLTGRR